MLEILQRMADNYSRIKPKDIQGLVNIKVGDQEFTLSMTEDSVAISPGVSEERTADFFMSEDVFQKLHQGTWTGLTAAGREDMRQAAPLDFRPGPGQQLSHQLLHMVYHMGTHFFAGQYPQVVRFGKENARVVHGGHAVALAYGYGVRFAYYTIADGEQINDENDRNPFYQLFSVIGGKGTAMVAGKEIELEKGVAVHVPINETHILRAASEQQLELFVLMYGPGA